MTSGVSPLHLHICFRPHRQSHVVRQSCDYQVEYLSYYPVAEGDRKSREEVSVSCELQVLSLVSLVAISLGYSSSNKPRPWVAGSYYGQAFSGPEHTGSGSWVEYQWLHLCSAVPPESICSFATRILRAIFLVVHSFSVCSSSFSVQVATLNALELSVVRKAFFDMYFLYLFILASLALANDPAIFNPRAVATQNLAIDPTEIPVSSCSSGWTRCPGGWNGGFVCVDKREGDVCCPQGCKLLSEDTESVHSFDAPDGCPVGYFCLIEGKCCPDVSLNFLICRLCSVHYKVLRTTCPNFFTFGS